MPQPGIPLPLAGAGRKLAVTGIDGGWNLRRRLTEMGLTPGTVITVIGGCHPSPLLLDIRGFRLGLGCGIAHRIMIKEVTDEQKR
jgi:ferrous iron transport protein A